ncbi:tail fiber protein [Escherichia coli]|nr:tail fiber protein [Escherichia coli]
MQTLMPPVNTPDGLFHDGDPTQGFEGTIVTADYMNNHQAATRDLQQEVINVLKEAGITPDPQKQTQLAEALTTFIGQKIPDASLTQKGVVQLNSAVNSESETEAATPKAVRIAMDNANARVAKERNGADIPDKPLFLDNIGGVPKTRKINGQSLSGDITIPTGISQATADSRYIQNVQLGAQVQGGYQAPAGCVVTFVDGGENMEFIKYKPLQIFINGAWRTISG